MKSYSCPLCGKQTKSYTGLCDVCDTRGYWIDPVGGIHFDDPDGQFTDPAAMYE